MPLDERHFLLLQFFQGRLNFQTAFFKQTEPIACRGCGPWQRDVRSSNGFDESGADIRSLLHSL